ncbi:MULTISPECIES: nucleoside hydrolase-like domain-containing protein [unclassified Actinomyces]|uniref:nucleoside hydrolase-like domain-containing protein n=1 Tax=unclassified Actinomyces TaxID=2609248 RepID=UPI00201749A2|nr:MULTISPECIES: nucleoside hydrolase-like domain-containing protein [unclassified Actinomyces]MCL3777433.1 DUF1593 domain-containing protein [Actinomyces sp. AC-20-1]MCL3789750.1 DUF1593 domain-containing protein [Actinomyces sp. 187325]MCL3792112.1 DUF1593 domain-containing protein [Actinomyces sp. 186855]MCL3794804.1 DUF1593 domain-containing protein [Actinomyces sp. 217892]
MLRQPYPRTDAPRVIVTTDPELDDLNSMLRLLLHANELDLIGLVYSASGPHHRGCAARGVAPFRWPAPGDILHIDQAVNAYAQVEDTLRLHDPRYPTAAYLRSITALGNVDEVGDMRETTPGSRLITDALLDCATAADGEDAARPLFVSAWGGLNTIARALLDTDAALSSLPSTEAEGGRARLGERLVITAFGEQDATWRTYIERVWPDVELRQVATLIWGYAARLSVLPEDAETLSPGWMREHVSAVGPMGAAYRVWGDGKQMAAGFDAEDYFGLRDVSEEELRAQGYMLFSTLEEPGAWISEGDSSNAALLFDNGLRSWEDATFGGWGGRQSLDPGARATYSTGMVLTGAPEPGHVPAVRERDRVPGAPADAEPPFEYMVARFWRAIQNELAGRLAWSVAERFEDANHPPLVEVAGGLTRSAAPGESLTLRATATDPDGDGVDLRWWAYPEAGRHPLPEGTPLALSDDGDGACTLTVPADAEPGTQVHLIAEVTDRPAEGRPPFTRYARVIVTVA